MDTARQARRRWGRGLLVLAGVTVLAWATVWAWPSRLLVQVAVTATGALGRVGDGKLSLDLPLAEVAAGGRVGWWVAPPAASISYQSAAAHAPLLGLGLIGAALQTRPVAQWQFVAAPTANRLYQPGPWQPLPLPAGATAAVDPRSQTAPDLRIFAELVAGRGPAGLLISLDPAANGYAFVVQPERRALEWWRVTAGQPTTLLHAGLYRPDAWTTLADALLDLTLALTATLALALLASAFAVGGGRWAVGGGRWAVGGQQPSIQNSERRTPNAEPHRHSAFRIPHSAFRFAPLLFALAGTVAAAAVALGPLEGIPHVQDDVAYLWQAKVFALGRAWAPEPPLPNFFQQGFILITDGRWFAKYPPGWPLLLVPGVWAGLPWLVNPLCAGASLALIYATGRRLYGAAAGAAAAGLGLLSPFLLFMSGSYMAHPATMLAVCVALYAFVRGQSAVGRGPWAVGRGSSPVVGTSPLLDSQSAIRNPQSGSRLAFHALAGFALAWAFICREATAVGVALPFALWAGVDIIYTLSRRLRHRKPANSTLNTQHSTLAAYAALVLGAVPPLLVLGWVNQAQLGSPFRLAQELVGSYDQLGFGPGFGPEEGGHSPALGLFNALVYARNLSGVLFGWPPALTFAPLLLALGALWGRPWRLARWDLFLCAGFVGLVGVYFAWWSATTIFGPRYWYEALPFLLLLSGRGLVVLGRGVAALAGPAHRFRVGLVMIVLIGPLLLYNLAQTLPDQVRAYTGYNDVDASSLRAVAAAHLDHALVFVGLNPDFARRDFGKVFFANDPLLRGPVVYARSIDAGRNRALLAAFPDRQPYYLPLSGPPQPGLGP
ncbi:MAG: hypothetical protein M3Z04_06130 [Chloroflexota bacterium]|nr:hypothetical protein [Chloroflexota bacterium]